MSRTITIAVAQMGPIPLAQTKPEVVARLIGLLREASAQGCELLLFPECCLTAFFPHWFIEDQSEIDTFFEREMPSPVTQPLFDEARRLKVGFCLGYAEIVEEKGVIHRYNSSLLVERDGRIVGKHRKIHLPGHQEHRPQNPFQNLEKRYFDVGNLGFQVWNAFGGIVGMCICNDRRWAETYRVLGLQGVELVLLGYNTPMEIPEYPELNPLVGFHNQLSMQAGAYQNGTWVLGAAKTGCEEGVEQLAESCVIAPSGEIRAVAKTNHDELIVHACDLDETIPYKEGLLNFEINRRVEYYQLITQQ
ncbi:MAG: N-carbamoyl-D-amino-acid hydrolase [Planctomycetes bacterium]|nr:N-carbamoyl-D-amino-acid hydrolase [Planctomycetota bacterium]MCH9723523.1 N-carbamoyl-D-amino-acid hydrolase [Planctomycetota bacterium]MCH9775316.1 N-carbamoyl-D-amino-acid hydrolase [Planctomycetota bacterium]